MSVPSARSRVYGRCARSVPSAAAANTDRVAARRYTWIMNHRTLIRRGARGAFVVGLALCVVLFATAAASTRYSIRKAGSPFWLSAEVNEATLRVAWFGLNPDGSRD